MESPPSAWKIIMLLADSAQAVEGKLYILGGGWSATGPMPTPSAIAIKFEVPWEAANRKHHLRIELLDSDGRPVLLPGPEAPQPMLIQADLEVGRPPGMTPGTPLDSPLAINIGPLPLQPGRYEWRCTVVEANVSQSCAFSFREPPVTVRLPPMQ
ncbi:MAG: hypothetical protein JO351_00425 [Candidatus Eremiobacteraeota bacterium]|nr:hypothetical protein [Candidatus Eremiobacteraeota bacterium]MBV9055087.1 hypothetical protein [Candidatus Eremiobacteraeota bacterium]